MDDKIRRRIAEMPIGEGNWYTIFHEVASLLDGWMGKYIMRKLIEWKLRTGENGGFLRITTFVGRVEVQMIFGGYELLDVKCKTIT